MRSQIVTASKNSTCIFEPFCACLSMAEATTLFRARIPTQRLKNASKVLEQLGMKPGDAFNIFLAQVELQKGLPFAVTTEPKPLFAAEEQGKIWNDFLGEY